MPARRDGSATLAMVGRYPRSLNKFSWDRGRKNLLIDKPPFAEMRMSDCHFMMTVVSIQRRGELMSRMAMFTRWAIASHRKLTVELRRLRGSLSERPSATLSLKASLKLPPPSIPSLATTAVLRTAIFFRSSGRTTGGRSALYSAALPISFMCFDPRIPNGREP